MAAEMCTYDATLGEVTLYPSNGFSLCKSTTSGSPDTARRRRLEPKPVRYWNDESYAQFYANSKEEQRILRNAAGGAGLTSASSVKVDTAWRIHGSGAPQNGADVRGAGPRGKPSDGRVARFQHAFAELSGGRKWIRSTDVQTLLRTMGLDFRLDGVMELLKGMLTLDDPKDTIDDEISYDIAFQVYCQALSLPPGSEEVQTVVEDALTAFLVGDDPEVVHPSGKKWSRPMSVQDDDPCIAALASATVARAVLENIEEHRSAEHASLYHPPRILDGKARGASIFRQVGRFRVSPKVFA